MPAATRTARLASAATSRLASARASRISALELLEVLAAAKAANPTNDYIVEAFHDAVRLHQEMLDDVAELEAEANQN